MPGGAAIAPGPQGGPNNGFIDATSTGLARLTNVEYSQTVSDVLGEPADAAARYHFPDDPRQHGFDNSVALLQISATHADRYAAAAESIAAATFADPIRRALVLKCDPATGATCLKGYTQGVGRRLYRRPLRDDEVAGFATLVTSTAGGADPSRVQSSCSRPCCSRRISSTASSSASPLRRDPISSDWAASSSRRACPTCCSARHPTKRSSIRRRRARSTRPPA